MRLGFLWVGGRPEVEEMLVIVSTDKKKCDSLIIMDDVLTLNSVFSFRSSIIRKLMSSWVEYQFLNGDSDVLILLLIQEIGQVEWVKFSGPVSYSWKNYIYFKVYSNFHLLHLNYNYYSLKGGNYRISTPWDFKIWSIYCFSDHLRESISFSSFRTEKHWFYNFDFSWSIFHTKETLVSVSFDWTIFEIEYFNLTRTWIMI